MGAALLIRHSLSKNPFALTLRLRSGLKALSKCELILVLRQALKKQLFYAHNFNRLQ